MTTKYRTMKIKMEPQQKTMVISGIKEIAAPPRRGDMGPLHQSTTTTTATDREDTGGTAPRRKLVRPPGAVVAATDGTAVVE